MAKSRYAISPEKINANAPDKGFKLIADGAVSVNTNSINISDPFKSLFPIREEVLNAIIESMKATGFDQSQPLVMWQQANILLDGHTRLQAAKAIGITKIPVVFASFGSEDDALDYMYRLQFHRRNIKDSELITLAKNALEKYEKKYGEGGKADFLAKRFTGLSVGKAKKLIAVIDNAPEAKITDIINENLTITAVYKSLKMVHVNHFEEDKNSLIKPKPNKKDVASVEHEPSIYIKDGGIYIRDEEKCVLQMHEDYQETGLLEKLAEIVKKHLGV